jgi:hypothetical protein
MPKIRGRESARAKHATQQLLSEKETNAPAKIDLNRTDSSIPTSKSLISNKPGTYCPGALRLQHGTLRDETLTLDDIVQKGTKSSGSSTCRYCNLELDLELPKDYFVSRSSEDPEEEELVSEEDRGLTRLLFTSQHILASASLRNRKAMFRCLTCGRNKKDAEFRTLEEFVEHIASDH